MTSITDRMQTGGIFHNGRRYVSAKDSDPLISEGPFSIVYKCTVNENDAQLPGYVAVKVASWQIGVLDRQSVLAEKVALETISPHDGIIRLLDSWVDESRGELYLVMDYFEHGNLLKYSQTHRIDDETFCSLHFQFLAIIEHIHRQGFVFFDVKPENMLLAETNPPKLVLTDFGSARPLAQAHICKILATDFYTAPEIRNPALRDAVDECCDYYAWYMSLFYLLVVQDWPKNKGKECWGPHASYRRPLDFALIQGRTTDSFRGFLSAVYMCAPGSRKGHMISHPGPWVDDRRLAALHSSDKSIATRPEPRPVATWPAPASFQLFGPSDLPVAGPSTSTAVREPTAKRASAEKCMDKEKVGKVSGVGSTAGKRARTARRKAVKASAVVISEEEVDGPAQAIVKRRVGRVRKNYKC